MASSSTSQSAFSVSLMSSSWAIASQSRELIKDLEAIQDFPRLQNVSGLSGFLSLISSIGGSFQWQEDPLTAYLCTGRLKEASPGVVPCHDERLQCCQDGAPQQSPAGPPGPGSRHLSAMNCLRLALGRPLVPFTHRKCFWGLHNSSHPGPSKRLVAAKFAWKGMAKDIMARSQHCQDFAFRKVIAHAQAAVHPIVVTERQFSHIHVDPVGPVPTTGDGHTPLVRSTTASSCRGPSSETGYHDSGFLLPLTGALSVCLWAIRCASF